MNLDPLTDDLSSRGSWIWRGIREGLEIVKSNYCWEIGDDSNISVWKHKWVPKLDHTMDTNRWFMSIQKVSDLINKETNFWNIELLKSLFDDLTVRQITQIRIPFHEKDRIRWTQTSNGCFSVKSAYRFILNSRLDMTSVLNNQFPWSRF